MINFEFETGRTHIDGCGLCRIDAGDKSVHALYSSTNHRIILGLTEDPLVMNKDHGEEFGRREMLYLADQITTPVYRVYDKRGASGIMLVTNYEGAADVRDHPHTHLVPIVKNEMERLILPLEERGDVLIIARELREGIEETLSS